MASKSKGQPLHDRDQMHLECYEQSIKWGNLRPENNVTVAESAIKKSTYEYLDCEQSRRTVRKFISRHGEATVVSTLKYLRSCAIA
jgi:hypothetical protein